MTTILQAPLPGASPFSSSPLQSSSYPDVAALNDSLSYGRTPKQRPTYSPHDYARMFPDSAPSTAPSSPQLTYTSSSRRDSYASTPASSLSLERDNIDGDDDDDDDMVFPAFENSTIPHKPYQSPVAQEDVAGQVPGSTAVDVTSLPTHTRDDHAVKSEPTRHVDYLSHEWKEEDIWLSWSYVSHRRASLANGTRLENASWRSWMKAKNRLKTISPETLNWLKDCDVTWLYGPLQTIGSTTQSTDQTSPPPSRLSHSSSFICKKPILKKKSASAAILERSRSQHSLLQRASDIIRIQQSSPAHGRPILRRGNSEFTLPRYPNSSVVTTPAEHDMPGFVGPRSSFALPDAPTPSECKHVLFDEEVRQVQAIDSEDDDKPDETDAASFEDDDDDDGGLMMAPARTSGNASNRATPRGSFSNESKTIVPLPSTTLKCRTDTPEPPEANGLIGPWPTGRKLSPSPSQETLRPTRPSHNFLIDDDPEVNDEPWQPQSSLGNGSPYEDDDEDDNHPHMRRTESGMFMPYDENDEEAALNHSLFGQAKYAVNTFKDIAHVVWNVGWNRR